MTWSFFRCRKERLKALVSLIMGVLLVECLKDLTFIDDFYDGDGFMSKLTTSIDVVVIPVYAFILVELCRPGYLTRRVMLLHELPFVVLSVSFIASGNDVFYYILIALSAVYGFFYAVWTLVEIPRYHRMLKESFSYSENINLQWLRMVLVSFFIILLLWLSAATMFNMNVDTVYMFFSLTIWMFICFFISKHESVLDELQPIEEELEAKPAVSDLGERITRLFVAEKIYLNPRLRLSDIARQIGTNRTYLSQYFNQEMKTTFFDYVNDLRIDHARRLLAETDLTMERIAEQSGFCSKSTFYRAFKKRFGSTPPNKQT